MADSLYLDVVGVIVVLICLFAPVYMFWPDWKNPWKRSKCAEDCVEKAPAYLERGFYDGTVLRWTVDSGGVLKAFVAKSGRNPERLDKCSPIHALVNSDEARILDFRDPHFGNENPKNGFCEPSPVMVCISRWVGRPSVKVKILEMGEDKTDGMG